MYKILEKYKKNCNTISIDEEILKIGRLLSDISRNAKEEGIKLKTKFYDTKLTPDLAINEYIKNEEGRSFENLLIGNIAISIVKMSRRSVTITR